MNLIPFGEVAQERLEISRNYGLIEKVGGIWRLTAKCKSNYQPESYVMYLRGSIEKPLRLREIKTIPEPKLTPQQEVKTDACQQIIDEILNL